MPAPQLDPNLYPRTYRIGAGWQILLLLFGLGLLAGGLLMVWKYCDDPGAKEALVFAVVGPLVSFLGFYVIADTMLSKVVLSADAIEIHDLRPMRRLERAEIKGRRVLQTDQAGGTTLIFVPNDPEKKKLKLPMIVAKDDAMTRWIDTLPDLDKDDQAESVKEILQDMGDAATPEERLAQLAAAKKKAKSLNTTAGVACVVGYFVPGYLPIVALMGLLPWWALGLAAASPGLYTLNDHKNDARAGVGTAFVLPGFILMVSAVLDYHLIDWTPVHFAAATIALAISALAARVDKQLIRKKTIFIIAPLMIAYGYGAIIDVNALADQSKPVKYETHVVSKRITSGKGSHPQLTIQSWGDQPGGDVAVGMGVYKMVDSGSTVCVFKHEGAFRLPWYDVDLCNFGK